MVIHAGLNRVGRGFLHRSFAAMVRQFALDEEIERSEAEAALIGVAKSLANIRAQLYLTVGGEGGWEERSIGCRSMAGIDY